MLAARTREAEHSPQRYHYHPRDGLHARIVLRSIKSNLGDTVFFQREDLLQLPIFTHISTISRYGHIRIAVLHLLDTGELVRLSRTDLALPGKVRSYTSNFAHQEYLDTVRQLVKKMNKRTSFSVMDIVKVWNSDSHLSENSKRIAVRYAMTQLVKERVCRKRNEYEYVL